MKRILIEKPTGLKLGGRAGGAGGVRVNDASGNSKRSGIKAGDTVIYSSSFFGDELWPSDDPNYVRLSLSRAPSPICIEYVSSGGPSCGC